MKSRWSPLETLRAVAVRAPLVWVSAVSACEAVLTARFQALYGHAPHITSSYTYYSSVDSRFYGDPAVCGIELFVKPLFVLFFLLLPGLGYALVYSLARGQYRWVLPILGLCLFAEVIGTRNQALWPIFNAMTDHVL